jgi:very-short-patch-repair endonuclease
MKPCASCGLLHSSVYDNCHDCRAGINRNGKENEVVQYLRKVTDLNWFEHDRVSADNISECGRYRPDIVYDCGTHIVIVEVDEGQHKQYEKNCEEVRMNNITYGFGIPTVFIRFNPDTYVENGKKHDSSIKVRISPLRGWIRRFIEKIPEEMLTVKYLFYDQQNGSKKE